jgi:hypothetical protein
LEALILLVEVVALPELLETIWDWAYWHSRPLTQEEIAVGKSVFGDSVNYKRVRVNERERLFSKRAATAYVTFYTINYWGKMSNAHFLHELTHVWQYQHLGTRYMLWAIQGQHSEKGYNYGGEAALSAHQKIGLRAFNLEQQADIVSDYYQLKHNFGTHWISRNPQFLPLFEPYIAELRERRV